MEGDESDSEVEELIATVRLVGSGGDAGLEDSQGQSDEADDDRAEADFGALPAISELRQS
jgi:hypothetical protein